MAFPARLLPLLVLLALMGAGAQSPSATARQEKQALSDLNALRANPQYRAETGGAAPPLRWSAAAAAVARRHSLEMAAAHSLSHADADGPDPGTRLRRAGIVWSHVGENVAMAPTLAQAEAMLMDEPPFQPNHRGNILNRNFTEVGVGIAQSNDGLVFLTEDFFTP